MTTYKGVTRVPFRFRSGETVGYDFHLNGRVSPFIYRTAEIASKARARHYRARSPYYFGV